MDERDKWMVGWRGVDLAGYRCIGGGPVGRFDYQGVYKEIVVCSRTASGLSMKRTSLRRSPFLWGRRRLIYTQIFPILDPMGR
jgi:hypothetical protein